MACFGLLLVCTQLSCRNAGISFYAQNIAFVGIESHISLVRSTMEYGGIIWDPYTETNINRLERIQRQAPIFITGDYRSYI
jgi:hypothetical protein